MYRIDRNQRRVEQLRTTTFSEQGLQERTDLQEWIANDPEVLGEKLLIIQKEFDGFDNTKERLDLLALDLNGNLVVIENKLDDSGRDVVWQALKYASYCSQLTRSNIREIFQQYLDNSGSGAKADELLMDFFGAEDVNDIELNSSFGQRIILVAANFRREVTSTAMWLINHRIRLQCFKVTPFLLSNELLLSFEQIIPMQEAEEFLIGITEKNKEEQDDRDRVNRRHEAAFRFWQQCLPRLQARTGLFGGVNSQRSSWIGLGAGISDVAFQLVTGQSASRVELYISRRNQAENKWLFDHLHAQREEIEHEAGVSLNWLRLNDRIASRISLDLTTGIADEEHWPTVIDFFARSMEVLHPSMSRRLLAAVIPASGGQ